jgi:hypothetical protein
MSCGLDVPTGLAGERAAPGGSRSGFGSLD